MGAGQLHKIVQMLIIISPQAKSVMVGILLSDAWFIRIKPHWSPKIGFCQSIKKAQSKNTLYNVCAIIHAWKALILRFCLFFLF